MLDFFKKVGKARTNIIFNLSDMTLVRDTLNANISKVKEYYRENDIQINKLNSIVKILRLCNSKLTLCDEDYFYYFSDNADGISKKFGFISNSDPYVILKDQLFTNSLEIFLPIEDNTYMFLDSLLETTPIRLVMSPYDRLEVELYNGLLDMNGRLLAYEINIPHLAMMYREWYKLTNKTSPYVFLNGYIYPSMLDQFLNFSIVNRLIKMYNGVKLSPQENITRYVKTIDISKRLDGVLRTYIKTFANRHMPLDMIIDNTPTLNYVLSSTLKLNYMFTYSQTAWIKWFMLIPYIRFYLGFMGDIGRKMNLTRIYDMMYDFKMLRNRTYQIWRTNVSEEYGDSIRDDILYIQENYLPQQVKNLK